MFLDFPIEFLRHPLELLLFVDRRDAVNSDAVREGSFPFAMPVSEVNPLTLSQWTWVSFEIPMRIT